MNPSVMTVKGRLSIRQHTPPWGGSVQPRPLPDTLGAAPGDQGSMLFWVPLKLGLLWAEVRSVRGLMKLAFFTELEIAVK